jgi:hypothetical protein
MADDDTRANRAVGGTWGGGLVLLILLAGIVKFFAGGKSDKPTLPPPNAAPPSAGASAPPPVPATPPVARTDPRVGGGAQSPPRRRCPQEALGWNRSRCMLCRMQRTQQEADRFSDSDGFGFCADCGTCANAFAGHRANAERGLGSPPNVQQLARAYLRAIEAVGNQNPLFGVTFVAGFSEWGNDRAWREAWHNTAVLTVPGYSEGR